MTGIAGDGGGLGTQSRELAGETVDLPTASAPSGFRRSACVYAYDRLLLFLTFQIKLGRRERARMSHGKRRLIMTGVFRAHRATMNVYAHSRRWC